MEQLRSSSSLTPTMCSSLSRTQATAWRRRRGNGCSTASGARTAPAPARAAARGSAWPSRRGSSVRTAARSGPRTEPAEARGSLLRCRSRRARRYEPKSAERRSASRFLIRELLPRASGGAQPLPVDERRVHREVLDPLGLRQAVSPANLSERAADESVEDLPRRAGVDENDPVGSTQTKVQAHARRRYLGNHRLVGAHQLVRISAEPPDRRVHQITAQCVRTYGRVKPSRPKYSYAGVSIASEGASMSAMNLRAPATRPEPGGAVEADVHPARRHYFTVLARDILEPARPADQLLQPGPGVEPVDPLEKLGPFVLARAIYRLDDELTLRERGACTLCKRAAVPHDPVLGVVGLQPALSQPVLVRRGSAVRQ